MADKSAIEWTDATWNPIAGCSLESAGCANCYAMSMAFRHERMSAALGRMSPYAGLTRRVNGKAVWTGEVRPVPGALTLPLRWTKPRRIFVDSMSDLFHPGVPDAVLDEVFAVMALALQHTFIVLTKRSSRMRAYLSAARAHPVGLAVMERTLHAVAADPKSTVGTGVMLQGDVVHLKVWPLPNVWLGVSAEDQRRADERVPDLLATPAAVRFLSAEPLLGPISLEEAWNGENALDSECWGDCAWCKKGYPPLHNCQEGRGDWEKGRSGLDWIIVGGESGPDARLIHPQWVRDIRDACAAAGVPFFFKQWGAWKPISEMPEGEYDALYRSNRIARPHEDQGTVDEFHGRTCTVPTGFIGYGGATGLERAHRWVDGHGGVMLFRVGKGRAGRTLDGVVHDALPGGGP